MDGPHASRLVGRSGDGKSGGPGGWQSAQGAAALPDLWRGAARTRQASAQADHPWGANDPAYAQLRVLSHLSGGLFSRLYEELGLRAKVAFPPRLEESMVRLSTWMPFRPASRELAFFTGVQVAEATMRQVTGGSGAGAPAGRAEGHAGTRAARKPNGADLAVDEPGWLLHPNGGRRMERGDDASARGSLHSSGGERR